MTDPLHNIPLSEIFADALPRDRATQDPEAQAELEHSILTHGLRQPIEVWQLSQPQDGHRYGLISGHRRLAACRRLGHETIPAFLRSPRDIPDALAAMVTENEIRAQISPWEKGKLILDCLRTGLFDSEDAAIATLFGPLSRQKKARLRSITLVVEIFDGALATPERLSISRIERLASALRAGWEDLLSDTLRTSGSDTLAGQWSALEPVIHEALNPQNEDTAPGTPTAPRRSIKFARGLQIRREVTRSGWILRFSGPEARVPGLMDDVMETIERLFGTEG
ncbi:ParB/RepB/Spo0J family partition protein [Tateyamaria sp. ANG-S1]|uniref:ParB/RepB/Spo0J family partition protein n=1 Tax=Tateyamaria sp. ANG-S1 TaxID=1577905 RepID=UPI0006912367|nr:ParB/RepB/Spo0J family partition protein [Tateyamaria sp. ANG-S1]